MTAAAPSSMKICVFLSANDLDERYTGPTREFAELVGRGGHTLVWGGSDAGLMKVVADGVRAGGGRLAGFSVDFLRQFARDDADEMTYAKDLAERKALLLAAADAVVVLAGGLGTLDEATEALELRKHGLFDKPVVLLNTAGFYDGLILQLRRMDEEGFLPVPLADLVFIADTGADVLAHLEKAVPARTGAAVSGQA
ncbi:LOG family protein [Catellatospora citrea]|uniref:Cytokinin riboside 5'-monophosphate phosphoribohydrolase n=1 Tax=Catellatospora citrea TaxID=53366 RepID=A0A8J3NX53_9ACTN|nr:TIGR00730 family Rossman fold protein [Catellatospora citrea]GIF95967.1 cytokinin riboside 5'-monophosphate phosphoribohydrolase [Catellatospora citrea]